MTKRKTNEQFLKDIHDQVGDEYTPLEQYQGTHTPILMKHNNCGYEWKVTPDSFLHGSRCPKCASNHRKTNEQFLKEVRDKVGDEYTPLEPYKNSKTPILMRHNKCGYKWKIAPNNFINIGQRCPKCAVKQGAAKHRKTFINKGTCCPKRAIKYHKTNEQFLKEVYDSVGNEYTALEPYKNAKTPILMRHNKCGYEWRVAPGSFINQGTRCPKCSAKRVAAKFRKTNKQFLKELHNKVGNEYTVLEQYQGINTPILIRHNSCGYQWKISPDNFIRGQRCPKCSAKRVADKQRKTNKQFLKEVHDAVGDEYTVLEPYKNADTPILMRHNKCGYQWKISPANFINKGKRCPKCSAKRAAAKRRKTNEQFLKELHDQVGNEYTALEPYKSSKTPILMQHNKCGYKWKVRPSDFINKGAHCPKCSAKRAAAKRRKTNEQFLKELYDQVGNEYTPLEPYKNAKTPILMQHNKCGYKWKVSPSGFINKGTRCPSCNQSHGELFIEHYLKQHHIQYVAQKKFTDLRDKHHLSYDFYVNHHVLIEYQGIQHYRWVQHFGGKRKFAKQQRHDRLKAQYAKQRGYLLLAIPYKVDTQDKMNHYLDTHLPCMA